MWVGSRGESVKLDCIQVDLDSPASPLLPPDFINNSSDISCDGTLRSTRYHDVAKARSEYTICGWRNCPNFGRESLFLDHYMRIYFRDIFS